MAEERRAFEASDTPQALMEAELSTLQKSVDIISKQVIVGLEKVVAMESPYPLEYQEVCIERPDTVLEAALTSCCPKANWRRSLTGLRRMGHYN